MKLVILGAGASFDSIYQFYDNKKKVEWRPPLANDLLSPRANFRDIINRYPGAKSYMAQVNSVNDMEDFFQSEWEFIRNNRAVESLSNFINLQYCLQHLFYEISNKYSEEGLSNLDILVQDAYKYAKQKKEDVLFVTFNYDLFLEYSLRKIFYNKNKKAFDIDEYIQYPIKIFKPHGSCNWAKRFNFHRNLNGLSIFNYLYNNRLTLNQIEEFLESEFHLLKSPSSFYEQIPNSDEANYYYPQILIPLKKKDEFIMPDLHFKYLKQNLNKVDDILIIGWKGAENRFKELLKTYIGSREVKINVINANSSITDNNLVEEELNNFLPKATYEYFIEKRHHVTYDHTYADLNSVEDNKIIKYYDNGTFSAYTLNVMKNKHKNFFSLDK